ncbi:MAG: response regulator, partial [Acidimicrobiia bacterium]
MPRLLLVEDDPSIAEPLMAALRREGHEVTWSPTGAEGLEAAGPEVDLVLLDLGLPDIDGLEICRQIRTRLPDLPVLMLTARAEEVDAGRIVTADVLASAVPPGDHLVLRTPGGTVVSAGQIRAKGVVAVDVEAIGGITLRLETSDEFVRSKVRQAWLALGGLGALGLAVAAGLAGLQARRLAGPLDDLARAAGRLGGGDFST